MTATTVTPPSPAPERSGGAAARVRVRHVGTGAVVGVAVWVVAVVAGRAWAQHLIEDGVRIVLFTPPILGGERSSIPPVWLPALAGLGLAMGMPVVVDRLRWAWLLVSTSVAALAWWVALAVIDGARGLTRGLYWDADYADAVSRATSDPGGFLGGYVRQLPGYPIALRGHPPGFALLFGFLERMGLPGPGWATLAVLLIGASGIAAVLLTLRIVAGEGCARHAAPFLALAPAALWIATSTDALTMGTAAWVVALVSMAGTRRSWTGSVLAVAAGVLATFVALQSYGMVLMALPVAVVAVSQQRVRPTLVAGTTALVATLGLASVGFWWFDGLRATMHEYHTLDLERPYVPFLAINMAAWALALGPATAAGLASLRDRRVWLVVGGGVLAAVAAAISGLSSGEVERIWLPFTIWVAPAATSLWTSRRAAQGWLLAQVGVTIAVTTVIATNW